GGTASRRGGRPYAAPHLKDLRTRARPEGSLRPGVPNPLAPGLDLVELLRAQDRELTDLGRLDPQAVEQALEIVRADLQLPTDCVHADHNPEGLKTGLCVPLGLPGI